VKGMHHGRVRVHWGDLGYIGRHMPGALVLAENAPDVGDGMEGK
jgi:hypothetical protein